MRRERPQPAGHMVVLRVLGVLEREQAWHVFFGPGSGTGPVMPQQHLCSSCRLGTLALRRLILQTICALLQLPCDSSRQAMKRDLGITQWSLDWLLALSDGNPRPAVGDQVAPPCMPHGTGMWPAAVLARLPPLSHCWQRLSTAAPLVPQHRLLTTQHARSDQALHGRKWPSQPRLRAT